MTPTRYTLAMTEEELITARDSIIWCIENNQNAKLNTHLTGALAEVSATLMRIKTVNAECDAVDGVQLETLQEFKQRAHKEALSVSPFESIGDILKRIFDPARGPNGKQ